VTVAHVRRAVMVGLMLVPLAVPGYSQETSGTILGTLFDQTGGVLPGVKVKIIRTDTGQTRETVTNNVGQYSAALPIGNYEISFELPNFQVYTAKGIALHVNDRLSINAKLDVGAVETLTVTAERLVQSTAAVQHLIPPAAVRDLPLRTRTPVELVTLVPGVSSDLREDGCFCDQGNLDISINGARRSAVNWLLDGASNVNVHDNYTLVTTPSLEAIQEINVITSSYAAEWARNGGGVVNVITKSGTSRFSGSAYDFLRNDALTANPFFGATIRNPDFRLPDIDSTRLRYNNFGYSLGGPALPSRTKLFFFASQEWRRSTREKWGAVASVPDPSWLTNPASPNYVPPEARDPNAVKLLALWPAPNVPGTNRYQSTVTKALDTRQEFVRTDYTASANWSLTGRYLHERGDAHGEECLLYNLAPGHRHRVGRLAVVEARHVGGRLLYESSYQLSSHELSPENLVQTKGDLGIAIAEFFPENAADLIPNVSVAGLSPLRVSQPRLRTYVNHTFNSAVTVQHGSHTLKTGGLIGLERVSSNQVAKTTQGEFSFGPGGGFTGFQNFLRGNSAGACGSSCMYSEADTDVIDRFRFGRYELYVQDTWRISPRITFDLGLRYAIYPPLTDDGDMLFTFSPDAYDPAQAPTVADPDGDYLVAGSGNPSNGLRVAGKNSPYGRAIYGTDGNNLQPRLGAAWDPDGLGHTVVRAGYGMYFDQTQVQMFAQDVQGGTNWSYVDPFRTDVFIQNASLSDPRGATQGNGCYLLHGAQGTTQTCGPWWTLTPLVYATSDPFVAPRWQHWNVGVQRRLYLRGMIDVGYVGGRGDHLPRFVDINQPPTESRAFPAHQVRPFRGYVDVYMRETTAKSRYHGFLTSFRHEAGRGGSIHANYTLSRNQADATYDNSEFDNPQNVLDKDAEFAAAGTDRTHIFNASYIYELPFAREATQGWKKGLLRGWQLTGITRIESGPAGRVRVGNCYSFDWCLSNPRRPNQVGDPAAGDQDGLLWFNPAAFETPPEREYGTAAVVPFRLPGRHQWDFSLSKTTYLSGKALQFRMDLINAFNQTQFLDVDTYCSPPVGKTTCDGDPSFGKFTSARPPREIQFGARFNW
jgi:hypothetical protein